VIPFAAAAALGAAAAGGRWWRRHHARRAEREAAARLPLGEDGLIEGAAPIVLERDGGPAVLLLHGAGDTPASMRYLATALHEAGYAVHVPLLPGHGRTIRHYTAVTADDLFAAAQDALKALRGGHRSVAVAGLSMGGALAARLAASDAGAGLAAAVLLAPYLTPPRYVRAAAFCARGWGLVREYVTTMDPRSIHDPVERERALGYGVMTPAALRALVATADAAFAALPHVMVPTLMVHSRHDNRVPEAPARRAFARIGATDKRLLWRDVGGHILPVDHGRDEVFAAVIDWLGAHRAAEDAPAATGRPLTAAG
jgi:carboxylesterase